MAKKEEIKKEEVKAIVKATDKKEAEKNKKKVVRIIDVNGQKLTLPSMEEAQNYVKAYGGKIVL